MVHRFDVTKSRSFKTARLIIAALVGLALSPVLIAFLDVNVEKAASDRHWDLWLSRAIKAMGDMPWVGSLWFWIPLFFVVGIGFSLWTAQWWLEWFFPLPSSPLELWIDAKNPSRQFWEQDQRQDEQSGYVFYAWEYRVEVRNSGTTTIKNIVVSFVDRETREYRVAESGEPFDLDPGQFKLATLFSVSDDWPNQDDETSDLVPWRIAVKATARDVAPSAILKIDYLPSVAGYAAPNGPYDVKT